MEYELELDNAIQAVKDAKAEKVLIQLPEGLKTRAKEIMRKIEEETNAETVLDGEMIWGACCIPPEGKRNKYNLVIHFGHTKFIEAKNTVYIPVKSTREVYNVAKKATEKAEGEIIGITTLTQHLHKLDDMKKAVEDAGKTPVTYEGSEYIQEAQILGCCFMSATEIKNDVDSYIFIGSGKFHPQGVAHAVKREVIQGNPYNDEVNIIEPGQWDKEKELRKDKARNAESFAVITTTHPGQGYPPKSVEVKEKLKDKGKEAYEVKMTEITPSKLDYLPFDTFVINACPRIVQDDWKNYKKPVLLPSEIEEMMN